MKQLSSFLKEQYGRSVYKLSLTSGCTCPNRDGSLGRGGCTFCSEGGSGDFAAPPAPLPQQIEEAKALIRSKTDAELFIAYFQAFTNTYGPVSVLKELYEEAIRRDDIAILSLGTRPDCLKDDMLDMLKELGSIKPVWLELGLQTIHEDTARRFHRGYSLPVFEDAWQRLKQAGLTGIVHIIFGLPGESQEDMLDTVRYLAALDPPPDGVKLQMLNILKGTQMAKEYEESPFPLLSLEEYTDLVADSLEILPENTVIHRMTGDGPANLLIAPDWVRNKKKVLNTIHRKIRERQKTGV